MKSLPEVAELVPHEPPMRMVERIAEVSEESIVCEATVRDSSPFVRAGSMRAAAALEYMAQAAAVWTGWMARRHGEPPKPGYLVRVREMHLETDAFAAGDELVVQVALTAGDVNLGRFEGVVRARGSNEPLVRATFSVYREVT